MRVFQIVSAVLLLSVHNVLAASWSFTEGSISVQGKGSGVGGGLKEKYTTLRCFIGLLANYSDSHLANLCLRLSNLGPRISSKSSLPHKTARLRNGHTRPSSYYRTLLHTSTYPILSQLKSLAKARSSWCVHSTRLPVSPPLTMHQTHKDLPSQFLRPDTSLSAHILIASFGSSTGYSSLAFPLNIELDPNNAVAQPEKPLRYGKLSEIHHMFRSDPKSPNIVIVLFFTVAALTALPILFGTVRSSSRCLYSHSPANTLIVALPWCQFLPLRESSFRCTNLTRPLLWQHSRYRRYILHVLHIMEPVPDVACAHSCGHSGLRQWQ